MTTPASGRRFRFGTFEADAATGELRRQGVRVKLNAQPFEALLLLLERPGDVLTRAEISRRLWPDGTFVDYEHGVNSAINRLREALGDTASNPRFVETLARRGYRFVAPVEEIGDAVEAPAEAQREEESQPGETVPHRSRSILAQPEDLPTVSHGLAQALYVLLQVMYLGFYAGALGNLPEIQELIAVLPSAGAIYLTVLGSAAVLIPVRAFMICAVFFRAPKAKEKLLQIWPFLLAVDVLWSLAPFLLLHHISFGVALACTALLVYSPFAQRSLVLMGAARAATTRDAMAGPAK
ncbi:MAG TPA: transcriptional regulator [Acidobacteriaceae bacterium]|nr:transcriptional regulator [Acidobacteriaceae bacterium]